MPIVNNVRALLYVIILHVSAEVGSFRSLKEYSYPSFTYLESGDLHD